MKEVLNRLKLLKDADEMKESHFTAIKKEMLNSLIDDETSYELHDRIDLFETGTINYTDFITSIHTILNHSIKMKPAKINDDPPVSYISVKKYEYVLIALFLGWIGIHKF